MFSAIGGEPGKLGSNLLLRHNGPVINLGGKKSASVKAKVSLCLIVKFLIILFSSKSCANACVVKAIRYYLQMLKIVFDQVKNSCQ